MKAKVLELKNQLKEEVKNIFQQELPSLTSYFADLLEFTYNAITFFWDASNDYGSEVYYRFNYPLKCLLLIYNFIYGGPDKGEKAEKGEKPEEEEF